ncbi:MAG: flagellar rod assembly protein/muramidase FlgJ [bacterium ADurb.Bin374]|nr:MAG: flagellar rod assembly protein/muramidase FlgJ [bacterium ADurb.Bin374]
MAYKDNPDMFAAQLQRCGYATDPSYAKKLVSIMKTWNLYHYDT